MRAHRTATALQPNVLAAFKWPQPSTNTKKFHTDLKAVFKKAGFTIIAPVTVQVMDKCLVLTTE
jgi:hypothetical protein